MHDVCLQKLNVVFAMDRAGLVGDDGPTHHGAFDIAYLRRFPNIVLMAPRDEAMLVHMLRTALKYDDGPIALRYPRGSGVGVELPMRPKAIPIGTGEILREAGGGILRRRVALLGYGSGVGKALGAADILGLARPRGHGCGRALRQADRRRTGRAAGRRARAARDGRGGRAGRRLRLGRMGDAVHEAAGGSRRRILRVGLPDRYVTHGAPKLLHEEVGFTAERIAERVLAAVAERSGVAHGDPGPPWPGFLTSDAARQGLDALLVRAWDVPVAHPRRGIGARRGGDARRREADGPRSPGSS